MKLKEMRAQVLAEMEYIPDRPAPQNELRMAYFAARMHSLGKKAQAEKTAADVVRDCIKLLKVENPDARFVFDEDFFKRKK